MGTSCQKQLTEEAVEWQTEVEEQTERVQVEIAAEITKEIPAIQAGLEARTVELLQENARNAREDLVKRLGDERPINIELLDLGVEMTEKECHAMYQVAEELGLTEDFAIIDMPGIVGIKDPEAVLTDSRIQKLYEKGELKLGNIDDIIRQVKVPVENYHMDIDTTIALMRECLGFLKESKIPEDWKGRATVNNIVFVDRKDPIAMGEATPSRDLEKNLARSRNVYIYQNKNGRFFPLPTEKGEKADKERKEFYLTMAHEICHVNDVQMGRVDEIVVGPEGAAALKAQLRAGSVSPYAEYAIDRIQEHGGSFDEILGDPEVRAEHFAYWVVDSSKLCPEMRNLFDKHFSQ